MVELMKAILPEYGNYQGDLGPRRNFQLLQAGNHQPVDTINLVRFIV